MNRFIRALHLTLSPGKTGESTINFAEDVVNRPRDIGVITGRLSTPFDVKEESLRKDLPLDLGTTNEQIESVVSHFELMMLESLKPFSVEIEPGHDRWEKYLTVHLYRDGQVVLRDSPSKEIRRQPVAVFLRASGRDGRTLLRCVSPIGVLPIDDFQKQMDIHRVNQRSNKAKLCCILDSRANTYNVTVEADILFHPFTTQMKEVQELILRTTRQADSLEYELLPDRDRAMAEFRKDLVEEPRRE